MKWMDKFLNNFTRTFEAESEAYQAGFSGIASAVEAVDEAALRPVRSAIGASADEFVSEDVTIPRASVLGMNPSNPRQEMQDQTVPKEVLNAIGDTALSPLNVVGSGLFTKGVRGINRAVGPAAGRGMTMTSPSNYIPNFYGPTDIPETATPNRLDNLLFNYRDVIAPTVARVPKVGPRVSQALTEAKDPTDIMKGRIGKTDFLNWAGEGVRRAINNAVDPEARALYRSTGINQAFQDDVVRTLAQNAGTSRRPETKAIAQGQFNYLVGPVQAGREGPINPALQEIIRRSYLTEAVPFQKGSYNSLIRDNKLSGVAIEGGKEVKRTPRQADLDFIEEHIGQVWKGRRDEKFADAASPQLVIKTPSGKYTGNHMFDFQQKSGVRPLMKKIFAENSNPTKQEFYRLLEKHTGGKVKLHRKSQSFEEANENGFWVTGSFAGTAVTEGGVNFIAKVQPNGRVMAVVSDEHNFLERMPVVGAAVEKALPNRVVAATPPMFYNFKSKIQTKATKAESSEQKYREVLEGIASARPSREVLRAEREKQAGATMVGAGMFTGGSREEQRR